MERTKKPDFILVGISAAFVTVGVLLLASVSASFSLERTGNSFYFLNHQITVGLLPGLLLGLFMYLIPLKQLKKLALPALIGCIVLLALVFIPFFGGPLKGAHRWLYLGSFSFQPSEFLKPAFVIYAAAWLAGKIQQKKIQLSAFLPFFAVLASVGLLLILQPDISTLGIIAVTGLLMYFLSGTPFWHSLLLISGGFGALVALVHLAPYRFNRLAVFLNPDLDPLGKGYQIKQALIGIGSGGLTGVGLGLSFQKFGALPEPISDSVFAVVAEEIGFIGAFLILCLFLLFAWRSFVVTHRVQDPFAKLAALGIACWITFQALFNIGSMTGLLPLAGIPLPFISYGGSALIAELIGLGLLLNISKQA